MVEKLVHGFKLQNGDIFQNRISNFIGKGKLGYMVYMNPKYSKLSFVGDMENKIIGKIISIPNFINRFKKLSWEKNIFKRFFNTFVKYYIIETILQ